MENGQENTVATPPPATGSQDLSFLKDLSFSDSKTPVTPPPAASATTPATLTENKTPEQLATETANNNLNPDGTPKTTTPKGTQQQNTPENTNTTNTSQNQEIELDDEAVGSILSDVTNGQLKSVAQINQILEENAKLKAQVENPTALFKTGEERALFEFMKNYHGGDYSTGIQTYARLQSLDIPQMKSEDALREVYVLEQAKAGITRDKAEKMFQVEFDKKYGDLGELAEDFINKDGFFAKNALSASKQQFATPPVDAQQAEREQAIQKAQEQFSKTVDKEFSDYKGITISGLTENPNDNFNYEVKDVKVVEMAVRDQQTFFNNRYIGRDENGQTFFNGELMKMDMTRLIHGDEMDAELFKHGMMLGKERGIMERQNIPNSNTPPPSNISGTGNNIPKTLSESLTNAFK